MKKSYIPFSLILFLNLNHGWVKGDTLKLVERTVGSLHISIDPRMELLATIQLLANYRVINRNMRYSKDVLYYFKSFKTQKAVKMTDKLYKEHDFCHDAPVTSMLHLSQLPDLEQQIPFSDYLLRRGGGKKNLEQYRKSIKQFAEIANFEAFWNSKISFYKKILDITIADMGKIDLVKMMEDYFNEIQASYNIIISPAFRGGYGPKIPGTDGKKNIYACLSADDMKDDIPYLDGESLLYYVWHEFGHSFVNPLTEKYADRVASSEKLFTPIKNRMDYMAYGSWTICLNEHIIRAINVRLYELYLGVEKSKDLLNNDLKRSFIYIKPILEKLKEFEKQRDENNITFSEFYPELLNLLDSLQKVDYWKDIKFTGPINAVFEAEKIAYIYPTYDSDEKALKTAHDYVLKMFNVFAKSKGGLLLADTTALKTDLSEYGIMAYGTIEGNLFLKQYAVSFPFKIENQTIYAGKEYANKNTKLITCLPSPFNPKKGMVIYTAHSNKDIKGINNVLPVWNGGEEDYILFLNSNYIQKNGWYNKNEKWEFDEEK
jgi:hypothetical protein